MLTRKPGLYRCQLALTDSWENHENLFKLTWLAFSYAGNRADKISGVFTYQPRRLLIGIFVCRKYKQNGYFITWISYQTKKNLNRAIVKYSATNFLDLHKLEDVTN